MVRVSVGGHGHGHESRLLTTRTTNIVAYMFMMFVHADKFCVGGHVVARIERQILYITTLGSRLKWSTPMTKFHSSSDSMRTAAIPDLWLRI